MNIKEWREVLEIVERNPDKYDSFIAGAEHDQIWISCSALPESDDGKRLAKLGFDYEDGYWNRFV